MAVKTADKSTQALPNVGILTIVLEFDVAPASGDTTDVSLQTDGEGFKTILGVLGFDSDSANLGDVVTSISGSTITWAAGANVRKAVVIGR